jgi:hypothetical protein
MKRILYAGLIALALMGVILALDRFLFAEDFGLWSYTLGAFAGLALALLGVLTSLAKLLFSRRKVAGLAQGAMFILTGVLTFLLALLIWLATGMPTRAV